MRGRNVFMEDVFVGANGRTVAPPTSPNPTGGGTTQPMTPIKGDPLVNPTVTEPEDNTTPIKPLAPEITALSPEISDSISDLNQTLNDIKEEIGTVKPYYPPYVYPITHTRPVVILDELTGDTTVVGDTTPVFTGGGGGGGAMAMEEEPVEEKIAQPTDNKKKILWLILIAVAVYFGYRYWKKNK